jgi:hypothetical protein
MGGVWNWVSWNPAGPKTIQLWDLYLYKKFGENRAEIKAGYVSNSLDFVGFFVGGSTAAGAQGVYAILPYEVGMSYFPLTSPSVSIRIHGPASTYFTTAVQRSLDPGGGPTEVARNHTGVPFCSTRGQTAQHQRRRSVAWSERAVARSLGAGRLHEQSQRLHKLLDRPKRSRELLRLCVVGFSVDADQSGTPESRLVPGRFCRNRSEGAECICPLLLSKNLHRGAIPRASC